MGQDQSISKNSLSRLLKLLSVLIWSLVLYFLYRISLHNYLLFHGLSEVFSICIAFTLFAIAWNSRKFLDNNYLLLLGVAYFFIGFLDLMHTLSFSGMEIFQDYDYYANQLWIATRFMESFTLLIAMVFIGRKIKISGYPLLGTYGIAAALILLSIFHWKTFPVCFIEGQGLTLFKIISEYIISSILLIASGFLIYHRKYFSKKTFSYMLASLIFTVLSELFFTFYISNYGISNFVGHIFKILSFFYIYRSMIEEGLKKPHELIFNELRLEKQWVEEQNVVLKEKAETDGLTMLYNHSAILDKLNREMERARRYAIDLSIILFDLDHFKAVNDKLGHLAGDAVLKQTSAILQNHLRKTDHAGRYGGEEFLIILSHTSFSKALDAAENIRKAIEAHEIPITISGGVAAFKKDMDQHRFIEVADQMCYRAKEKGRNRIEPKN